MIYLVINESLSLQQRNKVLCFKTQHFISSAKDHSKKCGSVGCPIGFEAKDRMTEICEDAGCGVRG